MNTGAEAAPSDTRTPDSPILCPSRVAAGNLEPKRSWDALELDRPDVGEGHGLSLGRVDDLLADQHLAGPGVLGDPRRQVHRPAEVVTLLEDHRPRVDPERIWRLGVRIPRGAHQQRRLDGLGCLLCLPWVEYRCLSHLW